MKSDLYIYNLLLTSYQREINRMEHCARGLGSHTRSIGFKFLRSSLSLFSFAFTPLATLSSGWLFIPSIFSCSCCLLYSSKSESLNPTYIHNKIVSMILVDNDADKMLKKILNLKSGTYYFSPKF